MRTPHDRPSAQDLSPAAAAAEVAPRRKVDQRLELFARQRGLPALPEVVDPDVPVGKRSRGAKGKTVAAEAAPDQVSAEAYAERRTQAAAMGPGEPHPDAEAAQTAPDGTFPPFVLGPQWRTIGPTDIPNGQTYGTGTGSRVNVSGRVAAITVDPSNASHVLVGSAGGGVWESRDNGATWAARTDYQPTLATGALAFDPTAPSTVYALTGEGNFYRSQGAGLLRSTDGGTTWGMRATTPFVGQGGYRLAVDVANSARLFAATTGGLYISTDAGATWTSARSALTWDVSISPSNPQEVFAASADGVHQSSNGGTTWSAVSLPGAPTSWSRIAVSHAPSNGAIAYVWAASGDVAYLWRRDPAGKWSAIAVPTGASTGQAWYDWFLGVSPDNPGQIYLSEITLWRGDLAGSAWTWTDIASKKPGSSIHPDQHAIAFAPGNANVVWAGSDGGVFRSDDRGATWTACNTGIGITEVEYLAQNLGSARWLLTGTQDNGSLRYNGSPQWLHSQDGDGGDCSVDSNTPTTVFHTFYDMGMERSTASGDLGSWQWRGPNVPAGYANLFYPPVEVNGSTVAMAGSSIYISTDDAGAFIEVTLSLSTNAVASAMTMPNPTRIYVGSTRGDVVRMENSGGWSRTALASPASGWVSDLAVDPNNPSRIWATYSSSATGRVFRSDDGGTHWSDLTAGLPNLPINAVQVDPWNSHRVWVGADVGVWQSTDGGAHWTTYGLGLPNVLVEDLLVHPHARVLRAGTRNRGVWEIDMDWPSTFPICGTQFTGSLAANQTRRWFTFNWPATWHVIWTVVPTTPAPGAPQITWQVQVERASAEFATYWINVTNLTGAAVSFEGRYAILSRY